MLRVKHLVTAVALSAAAASAQAYYVTVDASTPLGSTGLYSQVFGVTTIDFNAGDPGGIAGSYDVVSGSLSGKYAAPDNLNTSQYLTVSYPAASGSATITLPGTYNYYGFYAGSIDGYNSIMMGSELVSGATLAALAETEANGDQSKAFYFNFFDLNPFSTVTLSSTNYAFETDNHAYGNVPEPVSLALLGLGLAGIGLARRRRIA